MQTPVRPGDWSNILGAVLASVVAESLTPSKDMKLEDYQAAACESLSRAAKELKEAYDILNNQDVNCWVPSLKVDALRDEVLKIETALKPTQKLPSKRWSKNDY